MVFFMPMPDANAFTAGSAGYLTQRVSWNRWKSAGGDGVRGYPGGLARFTGKTRNKRWVWEGNRHQ